MKRFVSIFTTSIMITAILFAVLLVGVRLFGLSPYTVLSGSMEPNYHVGSLVYVKEVEPHQLKVGDTITYTISGGTVVTHRIVEVLHDEDNPAIISFRTKGDNNKVADGTPVRSSNVIGKVVFSIPYIGYVTYFIQTPPGSYLAVGLLGVAILIAFIPDWIDKLFAKPAEQTEEGGEGTQPSEEDHSQSGSDEPT